MKLKDVDPWLLPMGWCPDVPAFRVVAPSATFVEVVFRDHPAGERQEIRSMSATSVAERHFWQWSGVPPLPCYRFRIHLADRTLDIADPWAQAISQQKLPRGIAWSVAEAAKPFDWQGLESVSIGAQEAVILELHVGDQTALWHEADAEPGTLAALSSSLASPVGLGHARDLGVNAVELLPVTAWPVDEGEGVNHWGYMPSFLCAVSGRYGEGYAAAPPGSWPEFDARGQYVDPGVALKAFVRTCHGVGVAVLLDVVYNHVSLHDENPLLLLDPGTWFHRDRAGGLRNSSGCGNDLNSGHPEMRALILHSVRRWLQEYRVDGLRLDLAELLDEQTLRSIVREARKVRPDALMIAEPWSFAGHRPAAIAALGYTVWNDRCRHGIKGRSAVGGHGYALAGVPDHGVQWQREMRVLLGGCGPEVGGHLPDAASSLNYVESHDDQTLGDFLRLALGEVRPGQEVERSEVAPLVGYALAVHKLVAALLLASRGAVMLSQGQSWGRAKVMASPGSSRGPLSGNSWDRATETNFLRWQDRDRNQALVDWYRDLIRWRRETLLPAWADGAWQHFVNADRALGLGYLVEGSGPRQAVLFNSDPTQAARFSLPAAPWRLSLGDPATLVDGRTGSVGLGACTAAILQAD